MKVAHFIWDFSVDSGRPQRFVSQLSRWLASMGHNATVITSGNNSLDNGIFEIRSLESMDFSDVLPLFVCSELQNWGDGLKFFAHILSYNILAASELMKLNRSGKYDVVHIHDWPSVLSAPCVKRESGIPLIFHIHSTEKGRSHGLGSKTIEALEYKGMDIADIVVTVSDAMRAELQSLGINGDKLRVVYNGVDAGKFRPERVSAEVARKVKEHYGITGETIVFTGRLAQVKGVHNLVMAMPEILKEFPSAKLIILGTGELDTQINFIVEHLELQDSVILKNEEVDEEGRIIHYGIADICVFPSVYEPSGVACMEAMSMGKPVVVGASGTSALREIVVDEGADRCGYHVNGADPADIAYGVVNMLESEKERKLMGKNARNRVLEYFTWDKIAMDMIEVYEEVIERKREVREPLEPSRYQLQLQ